MKFNKGKSHAFECMRCGFEWIPQVERPRRCPRCKTTEWLKTKEATILFTCPQCARIWFQHSCVESTHCPACHHLIEAPFYSRLTPREISLWRDSNRKVWKSKHSK